MQTSFAHLLAQEPESVATVISTPAHCMLQESKVGLRWRTEQEVVIGKGQFACGAKGCDERRALASYEVSCHHAFITLFA